MLEIDRKNFLGELGGVFDQDACSVMVPVDKLLEVPFLKSGLVMKGS